jgi:hypothetical protein
VKSHCCFIRKRTSRKITWSFLVERDRLGVIRAALIGGSSSPKGEASIEVYALDRPQLVISRQSAAKRLVSHLRNTRLSLRPAPRQSRRRGAQSRLTRTTSRTFAR